MYKYIFITILISISCNSIASNSNPIKAGDVKKIIIYTTKNESKKIKLSERESGQFVKEWNNKKSIGLCKYIAIIWVEIEITNGSKRKFRINSNNIKENNDYCYKINRDYSNLLLLKLK